MDAVYPPQDVPIAYTEIAGTVEHLSDSPDDYPLKQMYLGTGEATFLCTRGSQSVVI